jgi:hypothetical protein
MTKLINSLLPPLTIMRRRLRAMPLYSRAYSWCGRLVLACLLHRKAALSQHSPWPLVPKRIMLAVRNRVDRMRISVTLDQAVHIVTT